jgi:hypothetical protein
MRRHDKQPQRDQKNSHDTRDPLNSRTKQLLTDLDERDRETHVGENHGVPHALETHLPDGLQSGDECYAEEPEGEGPDETLRLLAR